MPKPVKRVSDVRPKQAVFAASLKQHPKRLVMLMEDEVVDMRSALPVDNVHWADEIHPSGTGFRRLAEDHWRPLLKAQFPGRGFD